MLTEEDFGISESCGSTWDRGMGTEEEGEAAFSFLLEGGDNDGEGTQDFNVSVVEHEEIQLVKIEAVGVEEHKNEEEDSSA